jgi:hypothetical protein
MRRFALLSVPLVTAALLGACSSSPAEGSTDDERTSPLTAYFEAMYGSGLSETEQQAEYDEQNRKTEELVAECMNDQGFEYVPNTSTGTVVSSSSDEVWDYDSREWVAQYGYGAVKNPSTDDAETLPEDGSGEEYQDPNADYVASLSESEQTAFYEALSGPSPTEEEMAAMEDGSYEWDWTKGGCYGQAQHEVMGDDPTQSEEFADLQDAINEFYEGQPTWPGLSELDAAWADCMSQAGHPGFTQQWDAQNSIYEDQNAVWETMDPDTGEIDQAAMDALGEKEVELALADLDCREQTDYREKQTDITFEAEQQFVDDHKAELDAMKAAAEQGR